MRTEPFIGLSNYLGEPYRSIWEIGNATGLRITDIITLKVKTLDVEKPTIKEQKTGKRKRIRIPARTRRKLQRLTAGAGGEDYIFAGTGQTGHITRQAVFKAYKKAAERANANCNVGTHTMRKNYALRNYKRGGLKYVQNKLNHDHIADTALYLLGKDRK